MGQTRYLYLTTGREDAEWFANAKGCSTIVQVTVPIEYLRVDPEDGIGDTVEDELNSAHGLPGKVILTKSLGPEHFKIITGLEEDTAAGPLKPTFVVDNDDPPGSKWAVFGDDEADNPAQIIYWKSRGKIVIQIFRSGPDVRGRDMLRWLKATYKLPIIVVEATMEASGYWDQMEQEGLIDGWDSDEFQGRVGKLKEDAGQQFYLRLGDLPKGGRSAIGASPNVYKHVQRKGATHEAGVSVYPVKWNGSRKRWVIDCNNLASLDGLFGQRRPAFIVTGKEIGKYGMDDEPLLRGVKIVMEVPYEQLFVPGWGSTPQPEDYLIDYDHGMDESIRSAMTIIEDANKVEVGDELLYALRAWGDNTTIDRAQKEQMLFRLSGQMAPFRQDYEMLYRGQAITEEQLQALKNGESITVDAHGRLSSWTTDLDTAFSFAEFADAEANVVIFKEGLKTFFDFGMFGEALAKLGREPEEDEYDLRDPIREEEVIVMNPVHFVISPEDVMHWFSYGSGGKLNEQ